MGRWHAFYARRLGARVVGVVDPHRSLDGTRRFERLGAALNAVQPDIVHICTPTETHVDIVDDCLSAGSHVICEKPLAMTRADTERLLGDAQERRLSLGVVHQLPFQRGMRQLRQRLGEIGEIEEARYVAATSGADGFEPSVRRRVLHEILPHPLSVFANLFDDRALSADWQVLSDNEHRLELTTLYRSLRLGIVISAKARPTCNGLTLTGDRAQGFVDFFHGYSVVHRSADRRLGKALRPFRMASANVQAAATNLVHRAHYRQPAYPGLPELIESFYESAGNADVTASNRDELLGIAGLIESLGR